MKPQLTSAATDGTTASGAAQVPQGCWPLYTTAPLGCQAARPLPMVYCLPGRRRIVLTTGAAWRGRPVTR